VGPGFLRFDFTHFKALTKEENTRVEDTVNEWILADLPVLSEVKAADQAKKEGAIALFGEKYGDTVRVVSMGAVSKELCGGTHARSTGSIGLFHIVSEASIAAGVRRIEALTGTNSLSLLRAKEEIVAQLMGMLKANEENIVSRVNDTCARIKALETENNALSQAAAADEVKAVIQKANNNLLGTIRWAAVNLGAVDRKKFTLLTDLISDAIKVQKLDTLVIFLAAAVDGKAQFAACAGNAAVKNSGIHCGDLVKAAAAQAQGGGGGSPHRAQAGGKDPARLAQAVDAVEALIRKKAGIS
jgi:alanyl-tRNA synthetase